jgi:hypothetical protein
MRQAPKGLSAGWSQSVGMWMPLARAACRIVIPGSAVIDFPLMIAFILAIL